MLPKLRKCARGNTVVYNSSNKSSKRKGMNLNKLGMLSVLSITCTKIMSSYA